MYQKMKIIIQLLYRYKTKMVGNNDFTDSFKNHAKSCQGNLVKQQRCQIQNLKNDQNLFFKTAKLVERFCKVCQNNPSGNSHILLNNTQTQNYDFDQVDPSSYKEAYAFKFDFSWADRIIPKHFI